MFRGYQECCSNGRRSPIRYKNAAESRPIAFSADSINQPVDHIVNVSLLQIAVLQQILLEMRKCEKKTGEEKPQDVRPVHGWQRRRKGCMDSIPD